jgi:hypothetical protein
MEKFGSGMEKFGPGIRYKHPGSVTLLVAVGLKFFKDDLKEQPK